ncbi:ATP-dependent acyl-CoA ligase [Pueribacillus theae]|uniref:ATP-dependent acyl-CoA ligase n=1 Tax=Pueribacillus theae TaxID=2171751 RepID=A0A2U1K3B5_9BACI|nr:AMP-binding protein [Pueribacillus theae]PWA12027.1 ATP-dependent acyl-CoA ligase [Pueribacillus theae]
MNMFTPLGAVQHWAKKEPNKLLLTFVSIEDDTFVEENRTAEQLLNNGLMLASALANVGLREGDRFALVMRNHPEFVEAMLASEILGTVFVPIDVRVQPERLAFMVLHTDCRGALVSEEGLGKIHALKAWPEPLEWAWVIDSDNDYCSTPYVASLNHIFQSIDKEKELPSPAKPRPLSDTMQMLFTSGTTGDPKAIQSNYHRFASVGALHTLLGLTPEDRPYTGLSLTHANAQLISLGYSLTLGLPLVISRTFTKSRLWDIVAHYGCTTFNLLGGMATALFSEPESPSERQHNVRFVLSAGMPAAMWEEFERRFNVKIFEFYGTAEGGMTFNPPGVGPVGSIGKPPAGIQCEILDRHDQPCAPFDIGEICFRNADGKADPVNYFKDPEASKKKTKGNWFRSGDCGYKDEEGWVYFSYRGGSAVRRNGEFIIVEDMMTALAKHPDINDVYVYGVALDSNSPGEKTVIAAIVLNEKRKLVIDDFLSKVSEVIGQGPHPDYFQVLAEIPKTASEKPVERFLVQHLNTGEGVIFSRRGDRVDSVRVNN